MRRGKIRRQCRAIPLTTKLLLNRQRKQGTGEGRTYRLPDNRPGRGDRFRRGPGPQCAASPPEAPGSAAQTVTRPARLAACPSPASAHHRQDPQRVPEGEACRLRRSAHACPASCPDCPACPRPAACDRLRRVWRSPSQRSPERPTPHLAAGGRSQGWRWPGLSAVLRSVMGRKAPPPGSTPAALHRGRPLRSGRATAVSPVTSPISSPHGQELLFRPGADSP